MGADSFFEREDIGGIKQDYYPAHNEKSRRSGFAQEYKGARVLEEGGKFDTLVKWGENEVLETERKRAVVERERGLLNILRSRIRHLKTCSSFPALYFRERAQKSFFFQEIQDSVGASTC